MQLHVFKAFLYVDLDEYEVVLVNQKLILRDWKVEDWHCGKKVVEVKMDKGEYFLGLKGLVSEHCQVQ